jgi:Protein of unknown function (DUF2723)
MDRLTLRPLLPCLLPATVALGLYLGTWCPFPTWLHFGMDGPELEAAGRLLGIPHPTGYPLLMLLVRVVGLLVRPPWSALNLITLTAAVTAVALAAAAGRGLARRLWPGETGPRLEHSVAAVVSGLTLATALSFWKQAVIGEVYTLHVAIVAAALALLVDPERRSPRRILLAAYVTGLGLPHHLQILPFAAVLCLWLLVEPGMVRAVLGSLRAALGPALGPARGGRFAGLSFALFALLCFASPATIYLVHYFRSRHNPPLDWGDPETWTRLWWSMSGAPYRGFLLGGGLDATLTRWTDAFIHGPVDQLGVPGAALAALGLALAAARAPRTALLLVLILGASSGIAAAYAIPDPAAYYLPAVLGLALAAGLGAGGLARAAVLASQSLGSPWRAAPYATVLGLLAASSALEIHRVRPHADARWDLAGLEYARVGTATLPPRALVITSGDGRTFSLWYGAWVLAPRADVAILYDHLLDWPWYQAAVKKQFPDLLLPPPEMTRVMKRALLITDQLGKRPVYVTELEPEIAHLFQVEAAGPLLKVTEGPDLTEAQRELAEEAEEEAKEAVKAAAMACALSLKPLGAPADSAR